MRESQLFQYPRVRNCVIRVICVICGSDDGMEPIKDYLLIGDLHTAALVSKTGSIDWLCLPHFDSPSIFAAMLDEKKGGAWTVETKGYAVDAKYIPDTAIVELLCTGKKSAFTIHDFMLPQPKEDVVPHFMIRKVTGVSGGSTVKFSLCPRPRYAKQEAAFRRKSARLFQARIGERSLWIHVPVGARVRRRNGGGKLDIAIDIQEGESKAVILEYSYESRLRFQDRDLEGETKNFWQDWVMKGRFFDFCRAELVRSAITLKLMQFYPSGGIIAAPTTSLPEEIGGSRNWDYRYVWLRDATFTLYALFVLGYTEEAQKFFRFVEDIAAGFSECDDEQCDVSIPIMFTIWGEHLYKEDILSHFGGYQQSRPVRIGNAASMQQQLDIYGSLVDAYYFMMKLGLPLSQRARSIILLLVRKIEEHWKEPDSGIWEVRDQLRHFTYGKVMSWVGVDRALRMADQLGISDEKRKNLGTLREEISRWVWENCFDKQRGTFLQSPDVHAQDATNFLFVLLQFLDRHDDRTKQVIQSTCEELCKNNIYIYRYQNEDGLPGGEGAFILCTYWYIAALAAVGEHQKALQYFEEFNTAIPAHGLIAEEIDPKSGEYLGNYPQAFSHIGYIMAAYYIQRYKPSGEDVPIPPSAS
ncbi:hypothetical protein COU77_03465 [Candidatus Peregrinibacteria bacterium CG10_big_fil_rev_8_21_14_0_10_49_16]|nr:MAG: hypothetical protein COW95_02875 [Candidatus Peregrinibacteria bacterium CG22_combo_CG10-13_8_21_14_all_49_11]PIR51869.1 MAG: hypothetical protein COU77_03465 [Candidatus Peregrinibacteria bacterium CG10_big_fil_rev_8_21_14_0_10_49_16]